jgi:outer membrane immunogenic protein
MLKYCLAAVLAVAGVTSPALAQEDPEPFAGPKVEALAGTDGGLILGGGLGYDFQRGKIVFGVEGEALTSTDRECETLDTTIQDRLCAKADRDLYAGGRIGVALGTGTLLYGKVGYTNLRLNETYDNGTAPGTGFDIAYSLDGVRVGGGIEQKLGRSLYVKGEYRYSNYEAGFWKHEGVAGIGLRF